MHLRQLATSYYPRQFVIIHPEQLPSHRAEDSQVVSVEVVLLVLAEPVKKDPAVSQTGGDYRASATTLSTPRERHALLEHAGP